MNEDRILTVMSEMQKALSDMQNKIQLIFEILGDMQEKIADIPEMKRDINSIKARLDVIEHSLKITNKQTRYHERFIDHLKAAPAH